MATLATDLRRPALIRLGTWTTALALAGIALALRLPDLGNPLLDVDEPLYLYIGRRMAEGALPYVDLWDRKPVGLFALFWAIGRLGGDPFVVGHAVALVFAWLTAVTLAGIARRLRGAGAGLAAGTIYLVWIAFLAGRSGQSPIFYNLPVALAAATVMRAWAEPRSDRAFRHGLAAMLLLGIALQLKPTVVFEGVALGLCLVAADRRRGLSWPDAAARAAGWAGLALAPTALALATYAALGHADAWWFANVESIFLRSPVPGESWLDRLPYLAIILAGPAIASAAGLARLAPADRSVPAIWLAAAAVGILAVPPYFSHYMLPLVAPLAVLAGVGVANGRLILTAIVLWAGWLMALMGLPSRAETAAARASVERLGAAVASHANGGCAFAFDAPPLLNLTTGACAPTRYPFGLHLALIRETTAIGIDPLVEVRRVLATRPPVIVVSGVSAYRQRSTERLVAGTLARAYRPVAHECGYTVYARR